MSFSELGLNPLILKAVEAAGYTEPSPVQAQSIPAALTGADLLVSAQTGSGKTAAFLLPSLCHLAEPAPVSGQGPRILVLTPTRELAQQVEKAARTYGKELRRLRTVSLVGGSPYALQLKMLSQPVDVVVATPGRLMDHMERGRIDFSRLEVLVLDEADRMLDMGFIDDIQSIVSRTPKTRQTLLFSATLDGVVGKLARELTRDPQRIEVVPCETRQAQIDQQLLFVDDHGHKTRLLDHLLTDVSLQQALIFTATKLGAEELTGSLQERGFAAEALHGDMPQHKRNRTLQRLREGRTKVLVATDVAARGIDVVGISHVINFDAPRQAEDYVHRIGRTGRAGRSGVAVTMLGFRDRHLQRSIERYTGQAIRIEVIAGLEPKARTERDGKPRGPRPGGGGYKGKSGYGNKDFGARKEGGSRGFEGKPSFGGSREFEGRRDFAGPRDANPGFPPRGDKAPGQGWVSRAEAGDRPRWNDGNKPYAKAAEGRAGQPAKESAGGSKAGYAKTGGYKGHQDHKHAATPDKPKRNARYW
jgi:superfamily II DNA/RNA helicase